ncbi:hypothetical protein SDC9_140854 [bioreactor metagenome]|uniref:Uncharacterized protein n=1 Tax=bioreactor metagenome TaxID=1076179 RepID=A0A645DZF7_9ZZZZ
MVSKEESARDGADDGDRPLDEQINPGGQNNAQQRSGKFGVPFSGPQDHGGHNNAGQQHGMPIGAEATFEIIDKLEQRRTGRGRGDAKEIIDLADEDDESDAGGKAGDDRRWNEGDKASQTQ